MLLILDVILRYLFAMCFHLLLVFVYFRYVPVLFM